MTKEQRRKKAVRYVNRRLTTILRELDSISNATETDALDERSRVRFLGLIEPVEDAKEWFVTSLGEDSK